MPSTDSSLFLVYRPILLTQSLTPAIALLLMDQLAGEVVDANISRVAARLGSLEDAQNALLVHIDRLEGALNVSGSSVDRCDLDVPRINHLRKRLEAVRLHLSKSHSRFERIRSRINGPYSS